MSTVKHSRNAAAVKRKRRSPEEIMTRLLSAAEEEFKLNGFRGATTSSIARRADVTEAQLFRYFDSKADIFREAIFKPLGQRLAEFNEQHINLEEAVDIRGSMRRYISELQKFISEHSQAFMSLVVTEAYARDQAQGLGAVESLSTYFERNAAVMDQRVSGKAKVAPELMVRVSFAAVLSSVLFKDWLFAGGVAGDDAISSAIVDFVIDGISANDDSGLMK